MDGNYKSYSYISSARRIDEILSTPQGNYTEENSLPDRDKLTYTNGFYANCTAVFVDIRNSSDLPGKYNRPKLAKLYRAYISEVVAVLNGVKKIREVNIVGDGVWAVINTPYTEDIDDVMDTLAQINSLIKMLNCKLKSADYEPIRVGIGAAWGRALMIKAGYAGSGLNDVVYMGDVVNLAAKLAAQGSKNYNPPIFVSADFYGNLKDENKKYCKLVWGAGYYTIDIVNLAMEAWYDENCRN